ncbi:MAG TPA: ferredoxin family protein [Clostridia bacterium]|jgi:NAD-dependent dihydropyrimidine dehydrogenase PreA subunit|nr:ferredoxin family protein [Clostridia bacterium]
MVVRNIDERACKKCLRCYQLCPMDVFYLEEDKNIIIQYREDCQSCYLCVHECPTGAIKVDPDRPLEIDDVFQKL